MILNDKESNMILKEVLVLGMSVLSHVGPIAL